MSRTERARRVSFFRRWSLRLGLVAATAAVGGFALLPRVSTGADYTVTHIQDDGTAGSLRDAIAAANAAGGGTPFEIDLALTPSDVITLASELEHINVDIIINGHGATVHGFNSQRIFFVEAGNVTIKNFTLTGASATGGAGGDAQRGGGGGGGLGAGSAIFVGSSANVTVENVAFTNNAAKGGNGGESSVVGTTNGGGGGGGLQGAGGSAGASGGGGGGGLTGTGGDGGIFGGGGGGGIVFSGDPGGFSGGTGAALGVVGGNGGDQYAPGSAAPLPGGGGGGGGELANGGAGNTYGGGGGGGYVAPGGVGGFGSGGGGGGRFGMGGTAGFGGGDGGGEYTSGNGGSGLGGAIFVMGGGTLTVVDSSFSGNTVTKGAGGTGSNPGSDGEEQGEAIYIANGTTLNFTVSGSGQLTVDDTIYGGGDLKKLGTGELILTGNNSFTGITEVDNGRLAVNGTLASSSVSVTSSGELGGSGLIDGELINSGIISPGNSIGQLGVNGDVTLNSSTQMEIEIDDSGHTDLLHVHGDVTINGGLVIVQAAPGSYHAGQSYTFLTYSGSRFGTGFAGITDNLAFFDAALQYGAQDVSFYLVSNGSNFVDIAQTYNQKSVATVFDNNPGSALQPIADEMLFMTDCQVQHSLDQMSGEVYGTTAQLQFQNTTNQMQMLAQQLRPNIGTSAFGGVAARPLPTEESLVSYDRDGGLVIRAQSDCSPRNTTWGSGYGLGGNAQTDGNAAGLGYKLGGVQIGIDRWLDEGTLAGLYGGYNYSQIDGQGLTQRVQANSGQVGGYYRRDDGCDYYLVASGVSIDAYDSSRTIGIGAFNATAEGNYDGWQSATYLERGRTYNVGLTAFQPYLAAQYIYLRQNSFSETNGGVAGLDVDGVDAHSLRGIVGMRASRELLTSRGLVLVPQLRAGWLHEFLDTNTLVSNRFGSVAGSSFNAQGLDLGRDWALLGAGLGWRITEQLTLTGNYDAQANVNQVFHVGSANVQYLW